VTKIGEARITHPVILFPESLKALRELSRSAREALPLEIALLVELRASQIKGCSVCVEVHARELKQAGASDDRLYAVAAWRDAPHFTEAERAMLALTEAATRLSDRSDPVPDEIWEEAARHPDERQLAALTLEIAGINARNRLNVTTAQPAGRRWQPFPSPRPGKPRCDRSAAPVARAHPALRTHPRGIARRRPGGHVAKRRASESSAS
jgi:AhpD family alkylhydroperoxidase